MTTEVVAYLRVSTADRGQDPQRQGDYVRDWAERHDFTIVQSFPDEGTSAAKVSPFDRPVFIKAIEAARTLKAKGILVETVDRVTREGAEVYYWTKVELRSRYGLELYLADTPPDQQDGLGGEVIASIKAALARHETDQRRRRTLEGMKRALEKGKKLGAPPKEVAPEHVKEIIRLRELGWGYRKIAHRISQLRGAYEVADVKIQKKRRISYQHVSRIIQREMAKQALADDDCESDEAVTE